MLSKALKGGIFVGSVHESLSCGKFKVIEIKTSKEVLIEFVKTGFQVVVQAVQIRLGTIKDRWSATYHGVGVIGSNYSVRDKSGRLVREYMIWSNMIKRCYEKDYETRNPTYNGCTISDNFKSYEYFYEWCSVQKGFENLDWQMDKDILSKGSRTYSEEFCVFVPREINNIFTTRARFRGEFPIGVHYSESKGGFIAQISKNNGKRLHLGIFKTPKDAYLAYKKAKELYIKEVADKWKDVIDVRVYEALISYEVEESD